MSARTAVTALTLSVLLAACGGGSGSHKAKPTRTAATLASAKPTAPPVAPPTTARAARPANPPLEQALVTAETENRLLVVDLPSGRVVRRIPVAPDPQDLATQGNGGEIVVVSTAAGKVTLLNGETWRPLKVLAGFDHPHIAAIAPDGKHAYVTDDARGTLTAIDLANLRLTSTIHVGAGAHHLSFDMMHQLAWVALGESARAIVVLSTEDFEHPRVIGRFNPGFEVHDLAFSNDSGKVWITSADSRDVTVFNGVDEQPMFRVPVGPPPQHVAVTEHYAYLTSGYGSSLEQVDGNTGRILHRATTPYGSFELAADGRYVVVSSLLRGMLAIYTPQLKLLRVVHLAPATREVALSLPAGSPP
jgi:YVTN family beta-propeller protein